MEVRGRKVVSGCLQRFEKEVGRKDTLLGASFSVGRMVGALSCKARLARRIW